jgi:hypothetical protein
MQSSLASGWFHWSEKLYDVKMELTPFYISIVPFSVGKMTFIPLSLRLST